MPVGTPQGEHWDQAFGGDIHYTNDLRESGKGEGGGGEARDHLADNARNGRNQMGTGQRPGYPLGTGKKLGDRTAEAQAGIGCKGSESRWNLAGTPTKSGEMITPEAEEEEV